jgi:prepilin-type N-terminal cleavage/methylation domain-containing protein
MTTKQNKGFTLLEILLVIAAIGILAAIVLVAINPNRQLAQVRDAQRRSDINTIYKALEQYLIDTGSYPSNVNTIFKDICKTGTEQVVGGVIDCTNKADLRVLVPTYLAAIPTDPSGGEYRLGISTENNKISLAVASSELGQRIIINILAWTPAEISTSLWLDADDLSTITLNGSNVSQWNDKSGNSRNATQVTVLNQPVYTAAGLNGKNVLTFDGSNDQLITPTFNLGDVGMVFKRSSSYQPVAQTTASANFRGLFGNSYPNYNTHSQYGINGAALQNSPPNTAVGASPFIVSAIDRRQLNNTSLRIGFGDPSYSHLNGFISEIVSSPNLSAANRQRLEGYLAWKWSLTSNLPANHPYKTVAP